MPNKDYSRHTFLGGEVSPSLYERCEMDQFPKWFSKAENIRFFETGGFRNRPGFVKIANTKYNTSGSIIKLLSFSFNDEESFLIELGDSYIRFYKNGQPIMNGDDPYELRSPFFGFDDVDIKYAQSGDILFIVHPNYGIYQLSRLRKDGTEWSIEKFKADILPMKEDNDNKAITVSAEDYEQQQKFVDIKKVGAAFYEDVSFEFDGSEIYTAESVTQEQLLSDLIELLGANYSLSIRNEKLYIVNKEVGQNVPDFSITFTTTSLVPYSKELTKSMGNEIVLSYSDFYVLDSVYVLHKMSSPTPIFEGTKNISADSIDRSAGLADGFGRVSMAFYYSQIQQICNGCNINTSANTISIFCPYIDLISSDPIYTTLRLTGQKTQTKTFTSSSQVDPSSIRYYSLEATEKDVFSELEKGECICINHSEDSSSISESVSASGSYTYGPVKSNGNWRLYTLGNWVGDITIKYSIDNGSTWIDCYNWASQDANDTPANINTSGSVEYNGVVLFKVTAYVTNIGSKPLQLNFYTPSYSVNSYYQVISKVSDYVVIAECIKNDVGEFSDNYNWRLPAFSAKEGWPQTIGFYQNRLFFAKDYILYGSKSNDFWDFYEPIELGDDDPMTMALLSTQVNNIKNIVTQRSFFTFTGGGEFGIGSEGALTQRDKYLKPFSSNGSAQCLPVIINDVVLFVDKSYNSIRALKYSLEADGYEAPDITLTLRYLLRNEKIISTDMIFEDKEALFLSDTGTVWVLKYIPDQNVLAWSHWKHAFGKITNICAVPNGAKHDLYIAVDGHNEKWIEKMQADVFLDTVEHFEATSDNEIIITDGEAGKKRLLFQNGQYYEVEILSDSKVNISQFKSEPFDIGAQYISEGTLLTPNIQLDEYSHSNYYKRNPFKVHFYYTDSYGFKVGVENGEKMSLDWQGINSTIDQETELTSGKKSVLIPSRFEDSPRVSFVQDQPYPMEIQDVLIETDFGGK